MAGTEENHHFVAVGKKGEGAALCRRLEPELETLILQKVEEVSFAIEAAKQVDQVICALHSLAVCLFPIDSSVVSDAIGSLYRNQVLAAWTPTDSGRDEWRHVFYQGAAFPAMSRILIYNVTSHWLGDFTILAREQVYDSFFVEGPPSEIIQTLVPALKQNGSYNVISSNIERLLILCLLEKKGALHMVLEFSFPGKVHGNSQELLKSYRSVTISRIAQLLASIPDKATLGALPLLKSNSFFQHIIIQLLDGAEQNASKYCSIIKSDATALDGSLLFVGEIFSRICRRGSADILADEMVPRILDLVKSCLSTSSDSTISIMLETNPKSEFWLRIVEAIKDSYALQRLSELLLRQLSTQKTSDVEGYWVLWVLFNRRLKHENTIRAMFLDKFLIWKVLPLCCLRWIIQFSILEHAPHNDACSQCPKTKIFFDAVQLLVTVWSKRDFVQSARVEQQAYITAAVGLCLERMTKQELEKTEDVLSSILQGVSCRLESPIHLVRKMGSSIALAFSRVVDPAKPLYLDDIYCENIDWGFSLLSCTKEPRDVQKFASNNAESKFSDGDTTRAYSDKKQKNMKDKERDNNVMISEVRKFAPSRMIGPSLLDSGHANDEDASDDESNHSETSSDSSLQPYDISDDDTDLQKRFSQLADISAALRKPDDPDGIERALVVAEKFIRASPDELHHSSGDLALALVHVRCTDVAVEGQEDSAEERRQMALVALIVTSPFESLDVLTKLLYSPNVDISQRILIIDVMTEAAQELADTTFITMNDHSRSLISPISQNQPWFVPSSSGPAGASPWKEVEELGALSWSHRYERELPSRPGQVKKGKSRRWSLGKARKSQPEQSKNKFPLYAAAFMLPAMQGYDKRRHGVDFLNRDFIVLGKLIHMLGVCMNCIAMHPEASALASHLLDMLRSREVAHHAEAYVRRSALFAASSILMALHPSYVASALIEGNHEISNGLEWIRIWALHIAESDPDTECSTMAMRCLQFHSEMALQTSRSLEAAESIRSKVSILPSKMKDIIIPSTNR